MTTMTSARRSSFWLNLGNNGFILIFAAWCCFLTLAAPHFATLDNLTLVLRQSAIIGIVAIGETLVVLLGGMDVSLLAILGLSGISTAWLMIHGLPLPGGAAMPLAPVLCVVAGVGIGVVSGLINGLLITRLRINPIIATLGMMSVLDGLSFTLTGGSSIFGDALNTLDFLWSGRLGPLPLLVLLLLTGYGVAWLVLNRTVFGAQVYASGSNPQAAFLAGVNVDRLKLLTFMIAGGLAGLGGVLSVARESAARAGMGGDLLFPVLTAVVLGGTRLSGGRGKIQHTLIAAVFLATIGNGLIQLGISTDTQRIISGVILIAALSLDRLNRSTR